MLCSFKANENLPQITCPSDFSRNTDAGLATASVSWPQPTATDEQGVAIVTCDFQYVANFPIGMNTVTCTATDNNNNQQTCSFVITVIGKRHQDGLKRDNIIMIRVDFQPANGIGVPVLDELELVSENNTQRAHVGLDNRVR